VRRVTRPWRALLLASLVACASPGQPPAQDAPAQDAGAAAEVEEPGPEEPGPDDPWEPFNRPVFAFNDFLSRYALEPVGRAWAWALPEFVRDSISRVYVNVRTPGVMVNDLLQWKPRAAGVDLARFLLNSSIGLAGLMDPAAAIGLDANREDFGQTFGVWGIPPGPYLVLPFFGPSSPRDAVGRAADSATVPVGWFVPIWATATITTVDLANEFSFIGADIAEERAAAFDWYAAVRNAHVSLRENLVRDRSETSETEEQADEEDDLYHLDEEMEE
jgi:phospholipid-binding lipoprotein MlaA